MTLEEIYSKFWAIREQIFNGKIRSFDFGDHKSPFGGSGIDFKEIRRWDKREPFQNINWSFSLASWPKDAYVVETIEPRMAPVVLVADVTASMLVQISEEQNKKRLLLELIGMLGFTAERLKDPVAICCVSDRVEFYLKPKIGRRNVLNCAKLIFEKIQFSEELLEKRTFGLQTNKTDLNKAINFISTTIKRPCAVVIISDFADIVNGRSTLNLRTLQRLAARSSQNFIAIFLDDPLELSWKGKRGLMPVMDIETGKFEHVRANRAAAIRNEFVQKRDELRKRLSGMGVDSAVISYGDHYNALAQFLAERRSTSR